VPNELITILAVDDESSNSDLVLRALRSRQDVQMLTAASATEALSLMQARRIDLLILDQRMPQMTGVELLERCTMLAARPACIMLTAFPEDAPVIAAEARGLVHCVLAKPWQAADLVMAIDVVLAMLARRGA
jgi:CheY-like chemotaxis protein